MKRIVAETTQQSSAMGLFRAQYSRHGLYLAVGLLLLILAVAWASVVSPTAAATLYQAKGSSTQAEAAGGAPQIPTCDPNWLVVPSPNIFNEVGSNLRDVEIISANDIWVVGNHTNDLGFTSHTLIQHWNGSAWSIVPSPSPGTLQNSLARVAAISATDIWAVGIYSNNLASQTLTLHYDGTSWTTVSSPSPGTDDNALVEVAALASNNVWAVGYYDNGTAYRTLAMRWNGSVWTVSATPNANSDDNILYGLTVIDANNIWAVGLYFNSTAYRTLAMRWNGTTWNFSSTPNVGTGSNYLNRVEAVAANDIWAVGSYFGPSGRRTLILRYNGTVWSTVTSPNSGTGDNELWGLAVASANDIWAVGTYNNGTVTRTLILRWDGSAWSIVPSPNVGPDDNSLQSVAAGPGGEVWAVGRYQGQALAEQWNGSFWNAIPTQPVIIGGNGLWDVDAASSSQVWSVGEALDDDEESKTLIQRWDGAAWSVVASPNGGIATSDNYLRGVEVVAANDVWAVGYYNDGGANADRTLILRWDGAAWNVVSSSNVGADDNRLFAVTAVAANDVWAVGYYTSSGVAQTLVLRWNGSAWSVVNSPNSGPGNNNLYGVTAVSANDVWAVGRFVVGGVSQSLVERWNGSTWNIVTSPNVGAGPNLLTDVSAASANDVWAVGNYDNGNNHTLTMRWDGSTWNVVTSPDAGPGDSYPQGVVAVSPTEAWMVGYYENGTSTQTLVERWNGSSWNVVTSPNPSMSNNLLTRVTTVPGGATDVWAVGYYEGAQIYQTLVERYNPCDCSIGFTDVPEGSTFYDFVVCMACQGIISGYTTGCETGDPCFRPNNNVTRGQLSKIVANAAGFSEPVGAQQYEDVPPGSTFFDFVWRLSDRGIVGGYACGGPGEPCVAPGNLPYFRPNGNATRGQISKIVANAANLSDPPGNQIFEDVPPGSTFFDFVQRLTNLGVMGGYACGGPGEPCVPPGNLAYFRPQNNATRGQTSKVVANSFFPNCDTIAAQKRK